MPGSSFSSLARSRGGRHQRAWELLPPAQFSGEQRGDAGGAGEAAQVGLHSHQGGSVDLGAGSEVCVCSPRLSQPGFLLMVSSGKVEDMCAIKPDAVE